MRAAVGWGTAVGGERGVTAALTITQGFVKLVVVGGRRARRRVGFCGRGKNRSGAPVHGATAGLYSKSEVVVTSGRRCGVWTHGV